MPVFVDYCRRRENYFDLFAESPKVAKTDFLFWKK
jgi:hypothetical protein